MQSRVWRWFGVIVLLSVFFYSNFITLTIPNITKIGFPNSNAAECAPFNESIEINYRMSYEIHKRIDSEKNNLDIRLLINGTHYFYENGSINYFFSKKITQSLLFDYLGNIPGFGQLIMTGMQNSTLTTFFSQRVESNSTDFSNSDSYYSIFWLSSDPCNAIDIKGGDKFRYFATTSPVLFIVQYTNPDLAYGSWSPQITELRKNVPVVNTFYLTFTTRMDSAHLKIDLYYDKVNTQLLRADISYANEEIQEQFFLSLKLLQSDLPIQILPKNVYWEEWINMWIKYGLIIGIPVLFITGLFILRYLRKTKTEKPIKKKKIDTLLDKI
jgi:hypothetical protein